MKLIDVLQGASNAAAQQVSGNVDLIAAALRAMGVPVPQAPVMSTDWLRKQGLYKDVEDPYARAVGESAGIIGPMVAAAKAPQIAGGLLKMGENAAARQIKGPSASQRGIFIGPNAKTWDKAAAAQAEALEKAGADPRDIWQQTGTFRGPDGMLRQEISDDAASLTKQKLPTEYIDGYGNLESWKLTDAVKHDELLKAYPDAAEIRSSFSRNVPEYASYRDGMDWISYNEAVSKKPLFSDQQNAVIKQADDALQEFLSRSRVRRMDAIADKTAFVDDARFDRVFAKFGGEDIERKRKELSSVLLNARKEAIKNPAGGNALDGKNTLSATLHELQHAVQKREAFAKGGNFETAHLPEVRAINERLKWASKEMDAMQQHITHANPEIAARAKEQLKLLDQHYKQLLNERANLNPEDIYRRLAGEAEARAVQSRMNLTPAQRRGLFPFDSYDVPVDQLIVRKDGGTSMSIDTDALKKKFPDIDFWLSQRGDKATLDKVVVPKNKRNAGEGTAFMQALVDAADVDKAKLALSPSSAFGGSKTRLTEFYKRFGFVPNKGQNKDFEFMETMIRKPKP